MTWETVKSKIIFWRDVEDFSASGWYQIDADPARVAEIESKVLWALESLYATSGIAANYLETLTRGTNKLRIAGLTDAVASQIGPAAASSSGNANEGLQINIAQAERLFWFNEQGKLVKADLRLIIAHELSHLVDNASYSNGVGASDPVAPGNFPLPDSTKNAGNFNFDGRAVTDQNRIARQMAVQDADLLSQLRASYEGTDTGPSRTGFTHDRDYTDGSTIGTVRYGRDNVPASPGDNIDHSLRTSSSPGGLRDLIFAFSGNDIIHAGGGNDFLYGGAGSDLVNGGYADGSNRETDGVDTAGYIDLGPQTGGVEILLSDTTPNSSFSNNPLARYATWVQDRDSPGEIDMLVSIERIDGSDGDDVFRVTSFNAERLADPVTGQGGLARVDLGTQSSNGIRQGDKFDASGFIGPLLISSGLSGEGTPTGYVRSLDAQGGQLNIDGVEWYVGSQGDDIFNIYGDGRTIEGEAGEDRIRVYGDGHFLFGGADDDTYLLEGFDNYLSDFEGRSTIKISGWDNTSISGDDTGDRVTVTGQRNVVITGPGADIVHLSGGENNITLGAGNDRLILDDTGGIDHAHVNLVFGGAGEDTFVIRLGGPATIFNGGADNDTYDGRQQVGLAVFPRDGYVVDYHQGDGFDRLLTKIPVGLRNPHFNQDGSVEGAPTDTTGISRVLFSDYIYTQIRLEWNAQLLDTWTQGSDLRQYLYRGDLVMFDKISGQPIFDFGITFGVTDSAELGNNPAYIRFLSLPAIQLADFVDVQHIEGLSSRYGYIEVSQGGSAARVVADVFDPNTTADMLFSDVADSPLLTNAAFGEGTPAIYNISVHLPPVFENIAIA
jgi:RTX calcium-binding nonapeptide repeat (4 copies)